MFYRPSRPAAWALDGLSRRRIWWWRLAPRDGGRAARWAAATGFATIAGVAVLFLSGTWPLQRTVSASCFPYEAGVPRTWQVLPGPPSPSTCGAGQGSLALRVAGYREDVVLVVQAEGPAGASELLGVFGYERTSRSGVAYTMLAESNRNLTAAMVAGRQVYTVRCERGAEASCRKAMTRLLDGSRFLGQPTRELAGDR